MTTLLKYDQAADEKRLAEIDAHLRAAGYWGARLTALNEERAQIVARLAQKRKLERSKQ